MYTTSVNCPLFHFLCVRYSLVPVVPKRLLDFLQLPSTFIMGVHSSCTKDLPAMVCTVCSGFVDDLFAMFSALSLLAEYPPFGWVPSLSIERVFLNVSS